MRCLTVWGAQDGKVVPIEQFRDVFGRSEQRTNLGGSWTGWSDTGDKFDEVAAYFDSSQKMTETVDTDDAGMNRIAGL